MVSILLASVFRVRSFPSSPNVLRPAALHNGCGCASKPCSILVVGRKVHSCGLMCNKFRSQNIGKVSVPVYPPESAASQDLDGGVKGG